MSSNVQIIVKTCQCAALLLGCVLSISNAVADEQPRSETVKFEDLNTGVPAGVEALYSRIHAAAKRVCEQSDPVMMAARGPCARKAEMQAVAKVDLPSLTAYYRMKTGQVVEPLSAQR
jgi:UrcA family protein